MSVTTGIVVSTAATTDTSIDLTSVTVGSDEGLIVVAASRALMTVSAVDWDIDGVNEGLTQIGSELDADGTVTLGVWYIATPTAGASKTVRVTFSGGSKNIIVHAIPVSGMDTTTMIGTPIQTSLSSQTSATATLTDGNTGDLHMACCAINRVSGITWIDGSETEIADSTNINVELAVSTAAGTTNTTLTSDFENSTIVAQTAFTIFVAPTPRLFVRISPAPGDGSDFNLSDQIGTSFKISPTYPIYGPPVLNVRGAYSGSTSTTTHTNNIEMGTGIKRKAIVFVGLEDTTVDISSVTFDGNTMVVPGGNGSPPRVGGDVLGRLFYFDIDDADPIGSKEVSISLDGSEQNISWNVWILNNTRSGALQDIQYDSDATTTDILTTTLTNIQKTYCCASVINGAVGTDASWTSDFTEWSDLTGNSQRCFAADVSGSTNVTATWDGSANSNDKILIVCSVQGG